MHILFESHPKVKGCLNTMSSKERRSVDFSKWETDNEGYVICLEAVMPEYTFEDKLLWEDSEKGTSIETSGMLPLEVQDWFNANIQGQWFYEVRMETSKANSMHYKKVVFTFHFEKLTDAMLFKLTW